MTRAAPKTLVVGGGIGGLAAAIALRRAGIDVEVFERAGRIEEVGAGIALWANGIRALDRLGVGEAVRNALLRRLGSRLQLRQLARMIGPCSAGSSDPADRRSAELQFRVSDQISSWQAEAIATTAYS